MNGEIPALSEVPPLPFPYNVYNIVYIIYNIVFGAAHAVRFGFSKGRVINLGRLNYHTAVVASSSSPTRYGHDECNRFLASIRNNNIILCYIVCKRTEILRKMHYTSPKIHSLLYITYYYCDHIIIFI